MSASRWSFDHFVFAEYKTTTSGLGIYRVLFAAYKLLVILPQQLWVSTVPQSFFNPPLGLTVFFTGFPGAPYFVFANSLAIVAAVCLLFRYRTRIASTSLPLLYFICNCWGYSFGKIDHDMPLIIVPLVACRRVTITRLSAS